MSRFRHLVGEANRRSLWQVLGLYLGASWVAFQVVKELTETVGLPEWVPPAALALLVIGFPVVLGTAFVQKGVGGSREERGASIHPSAEPSPPVANAGGPAGAGDAADAGGPADPSGSAGLSGLAPPRAPRVHHRLLTWRNAILGGAAAFTLLGLGTAGYMTLRTLGIGPAGTLVARGVMDARDRVVIAEFRTRSQDTALAAAVTEALRVDLAQSRVVRVAEPAYVAKVLRRMKREAGARLDAALAREVALREGMPAVVAGEVNAAGSSYVISARLLTAKTGEELAAFRETAKDDAAILPAVDRLSRRIRERIGESLRAFGREQPLARVTTADLDALRKYSQAVHVTEVEGDDDRAIALLEEAVALDTAFAMAWRKLGVLLQNNGQERARQVEAFTRAFRHRDRLTERERYFATATYYESGTGDRDRAITAYENLLELDPEHYGALNNLANIYGGLDDWERALELQRRALAVDSTLPLLHAQLVRIHVALARWEEAEEVLGAFSRRVPADDVTLNFTQARFAAVRGDYGAAEERLGELQNSYVGNLRVRAWTSWQLANLAGVRGRVASREQLLRQNVIANEERGLDGLVVEVGLQGALYDALVRERPEEAIRRIQATLSEYPLDSLPPLERPYAMLVRVYALAGRPDRARKAWTAWQAAVPEELRAAEEVAEAEADLAFGEGNFREAIAAYLRAERGRCLGRCPGLARAYDRAGERDSALAVYRRYIDSPRLTWSTFEDAFHLAPFRERLGELYDERGELERAAEQHAAFVELWAEADEELQPRVRAAQRRLDAIMAERG